MGVSILSIGRKGDMVFAAFVVGILVLARTAHLNGSSALCIDGRELGIVCLFRRLVGMNCPFCGLSRSFVAIAHFRAVDSLLFHPIGPVLAPCMAVTLICIGAFALRKSTPLVERRSFLIGSYVTVIACCITWGLRIFVT